jgi:hypothetical protein
MPDSAELIASGLWDWLAAEPDSKRAQTVRRLAKQANRQAWQEFIAGTLPKDPAGGLQLRFSPRAWDILGLTPRGARYERYKQRKLGGRNLPYTSPGRGTHMRDLLGIQGVGHTLRPERAAGGSVTTVLRLPGARVLNRIRNATRRAVYRAEFLQLSGRARAQSDAITARALDLLLALLRAYLASRQPRKQVA